ncbi:Ig-like domain-containing protein [Mariniflexile sp. AS56]|uniref:Ig-like domain-containing protein n=1 Tax=Mariniflexile sp. AS56 TaxID=3063957 RepID=UPI0026ECA763|nr:Ig-like domain-containing protein [Mariniflexile sp. AS56]MDO7171038.1 Ig-like domain-containing protein [Mariniflexile sp. AS56]
MKKFSLLFLVVLLFFNCSSSGEEDSPKPDPTPKGVSIAVDDNVTAVEDTDLIIQNLLSNDTIVNNAKITGFDSVTTNQGKIVDNRDGTYTYSPASGFLGEDTFTYTICDRETPPNCSTATVTITVTDEGDPVAVDDAISVIENTTIVINTLLENDDTIDGALIESIDVSATLGKVILNSNGTITYTPQLNFNGEDTFTYTICDNDKPNKTCATATVTITVTDEGNPVAVDDAINVLENTAKVITSLLENDDIIDGAVLKFINSSSSIGTVVLNLDGTVTYEPQTDFIGQDTFTYTICDNDTPNNSCATATVTITVLNSINFNIPTEIRDYYNGVIFSENTDLMFEELESITVSKHTSILSYGQRHEYLYNADADLTNTDNVILMYTSESRYWKEYTSGSNSYSPQTFNTEHIFPQSLLSTTDAVTDLHHLRSCDSGVNGQRSNYSFTTGSGANQLIGGNRWYPGDEWKGDVARMVLYLNIRYGEVITKVGTLEMFLQWNIEDPVSDFEVQRNNVIYAAQGNRNPFIDNAYLATLIWGGTDAENKWE